jgi:RecB family exonuclease
MGATCRREFLGWDAPFLPRAVRRFLELAAERAFDPERCVVVLPGRRAARQFEERLAEAAPCDLAPPRIVTEGALASAVADRELPLAPQAARTLAWIDALRSIPRERLTRAVAVPADLERASLGEWLAMVRAVDGALSELGAEGLDFHALAERLEPSIERERFAILSEAQARFDAALERQGWIDPPRAATEVASRGWLDESAQVVLAGVADLSGSQRSLLARLRQPAVSLVFAPEDEGAGFDAWGAIAPSAWASREIPLTGERWRVADDARALARDAVEWLRAERGPLAAEEVTLGALDDALPALYARAFSGAGLPTRDAGGTPFERTPPAVLLRALLDLSRTQSFASLAALVRHPDLETAELGGVDAAAAADEYFAEHLPVAAGEIGVAPTRAARRFAAVRERVEAFAGPLLGGAPRPLGGWTAELKRAIAAVYPVVERDPRDAPAWRRAQAVLALADAVDEVEECGACAGDVSAADAIELVLARAAQFPIPEPPRAGAIDVLGWLELALDEAPALYVGGFAEGAVPRPAGSEALLPEALRRAVRLPDEERRVARDAYLASAILASRPRAVFASARRNADGDPLRPSRLVFHCPSSEVVARVRRFFASAAPPPVTSSAPLARAPARPIAPPFAPFRVPETISVTSFRTYIESPYQFYLRHVLGLETCDDAARELDPRGFGNLAHDLVAAFGRGPLKDSADDAAIAEWLSSALDGLARERFGRSPRAAVRVQIEQLRLRARAFAAWQAAQRRDGWSIEHVERAIDDFVLDVDGAPQRLAGRIDRIDRHAATGAWRVLDYKAGDKAPHPSQARSRARGWLDLQLPLYRAMLRAELGPRIGLGYVLLPADPRGVGAATMEWSDAELDEAVEKARAIVRELRSGAMPERGKRPPRERVFTAIEGRGVLGGAAGTEADGGDVPEEGA